MAWPDFSLTDLYTAIVTKLNTGFTNASKLFRDQASGDLTNQIRYSSANKRLEYWTGSAWAALDFTGVAAGTASTATTATSASSISGYSVGNGRGNIPVSNGTVCTNLNAEKVGGLTLSQIQSGAVNWDTVAGAGLANSSGVLSVNTAGAISKSGDNVVLLYDNLTIKMNGSNQIYAEVPSQPTYAASDTGTNVAVKLFEDGTPMMARTNSTVYAKVAEQTALVGGTLYSSFRFYGASGPSSWGGTINAKIFVNGVAVGTEHSATGTSPSTKVDSSISVSAGDKIAIYAKTSIGYSDYSRFYYPVIDTWQLKSNSSFIPLVNLSTVIVDLPSSAPG